MRKRDPFLGGAFKGGGGQIIPPLALPFEAPGGIQRLQCWNTEGLFRLIDLRPTYEFNLSGCGIYGGCSVYSVYEGGFFRMLRPL